jgi:hypothetical protein
MLEQRLSQLAIEERKSKPISVSVAVRHVKAAFGGKEHFHSMLYPHATEVVPDPQHVGTPHLT